MPAPTLDVFLRARLDDDERLIGEYERYMGERGAAAGSFVPVIPPGWQPGEPFDPDRQLREVKAKRRIIDLHEGSHECSVYKRWTDMDGVAHEDINYCSWLLDSDECSTLRLLALEYADHPDYREEWKP